MYSSLYLGVSIISTGFYLDVSIMSTGFYLGVSIMSTGFYLGVSIISTGFYLGVSIMSTSFYLGLSIISTGFYLGVSIYLNILGDAERISPCNMCINYVHRFIPGCIYKTKYYRWCRASYISLYYVTMCM